MTSRGTHATDAQIDLQLAGAQDDEVYGALGALLGLLEVVVTDDAHPLSHVQGERLRSALQLGHRLEQQVDALLLLAADDLKARLRFARRALRPLVEHALRGALRAFASDMITLIVPEADAFADLQVYVDSSRVDRTLCALAEVLAAQVGPRGSIAIVIDRSEREVSLRLSGRSAEPPSKRAKREKNALIERAARRLFVLHGGGLRFDLEQLTMQVTLPLGEAP